MSGISIEDISGSLPSLSDVAEAQTVLRKFLITGILKLPPELAVQIPNLIRLVDLAEIVVRRLREQGAGK